MTKKIFAAIVLLSFYITGVAQKNETVDAYIKSYRQIAMNEMKRSGVPAAITLAQGILESMAGQSELVQKSNNHFGIKCKTDYDGPYVLHDDDSPKERFMKYESPEKSYVDHSDFLRGKQRYAFLFDIDPADYAGWANGLKKAGYATNPKYAQLLINLIERYNLQNYTMIGLGKADLPEDLKDFAAEHNGMVFVEKTPAIQYPQGDFKINDTRVVLAKKGTTFYEISKKYNVPLERLYSFNDFESPAGIALKDQLVYLQLKRTSGDKEFHMVQKGETIYDIAQQEGVRLEALLKYNNLTKFSTLQPASKLYLKEPAVLANN